MAPQTVNLSPVKKNRVADVVKKMPADDLLRELAEFFRVFGDPTRIKILCALVASTLCVQDLANILGMSQSSVSHQLRMLKDMRIVRYRREGRSIRYFLDDEHIKMIFDDGFSHISERRTRKVYGG